MGDCFWCHPAIPMTSICGRRPARLAIPPSAGPATTSKMWRRSSEQLWTDLTHFDTHRRLPVRFFLFFMDSFELTQTAICISSWKQTLLARIMPIIVSESDMMIYLLFTMAYCIHLRKKSSLCFSELTTKCSWNFCDNFSWKKENSALFFWIHRSQNPEALISASELRFMEANMSRLLSSIQFYFAFGLKHWEILLSLSSVGGIFISLLFCEYLMQVRANSCRILRWHCLINSEIE